MKDISSEIKKSHERFKLRQENGGELPREKQPDTPEFKAYLKKLEQSPLIKPTQKAIIKRINTKLDKNAVGGKFNPTNNQSRIMNALYAYFNDVGDLDTNKGILLSGSFGCGKTEIMRAFTTTHFKPFNPGTGDKACMVTSAIQMVEYYNADLNFNKFFDNNLYIDDFGSEQRAKFMSKNDEPILSKFLELWYLKRDYRLFLTTNLTKDELKQKYGDRVFSRLHQLCNFITFNDKDFRV